jgi:hypothetical protein
LAIEKWHNKDGAIEGHEVQFRSVASVLSNCTWAARSPTGSVGGCCRRGRTDFDQAISGDKVAAVEIGWVDTLENEDVEAVCNHCILATLSHEEVRRFTEPFAVSRSRLFGVTEYYFPSIK